MQYEYVAAIAGSSLYEQYFVYSISTWFKSRLTLSTESITGELRNAYGPAVINYHRNGVISKTKLWIEGSDHEENGPFMAKYYSNGSIAHVEHWLDHNGYRVDYRECYSYDPDMDIFNKVTTEYYSNGNVSSVTYNIGFGDDRYSINRWDGPAKTTYYPNGNIQREEYWYVGNQSMRRDGPGVINYDPNGKVTYSSRWEDGCERADTPFRSDDETDSDD